MNRNFRKMFLLKVIDLLEIYNFDIKFLFIQSRMKKLWKFIEWQIGLLPAEKNTQRNIVFAGCQRNTLGKTGLCRRTKIDSWQKPSLLTTKSTWLNAYLRECCIFAESSLPSAWGKALGKPPDLNKETIFPIVTGAPHYMFST